METDIKTPADSGTEAGPRRAVVPPPTNNDVCKFFRLGRCRFGTSCRFLHSTNTEGNNILRVGSEKEKIAETPATSVASTVTQQARKIEANGVTGTTSLTTIFDPSKWINAPVFVPKARTSYGLCQGNKEEDEDDEEEYVDEMENYQGLDEDDLDEEEKLDVDGGGARGLSYANIVTMNNNHNGTSDEGLLSPRASANDSRLCAYYEKYAVCAVRNCVYVHGLECELCNRFCMNPRDAEQRREHTIECIKQHEMDMEHSFAVQRSRDKTCGICLEVILEKRPREQRFGILPNCKHTFCLSCIRTWRKATNFENKIKRGCPSCRIPSDFVCPSYVWIESEEEKEKMIKDYKVACNATDCMHFKKGAAKCPFGNKCFYRHALPSGELIDVGAPQRRREPSTGRNRHVWRPLEDFFSELMDHRDVMLDEYYNVQSDEEDSDYDEFEDMFAIDYLYGDILTRRSSSGSFGYDDAIH